MIRTTVYKKSKLIILTLLLASCSTTEQNTSTTFDRLQGVPVVTDRASTGGVSWIDFDNDGDLDLVVTNGYDVSNPDGAFPQLNKFYLNNGDGTFTTLEDSPFATDETFSSGSTWGDYDNDGDPDVFISTQGNQNNIIYDNDGRGRLVIPQDSSATSQGGTSFGAAWVDVDSDGWLDLYVGNGGLSNIQPDFLYKNNRDGTFTQIFGNPITSDSIATVGGTWSDFDNDNDLDLYVPNRRGGDILYVNEGNWEFSKKEDFSLTREMRIFSSQGACTGDFDNDGDIDIYVGKTFGSANLLLVNDGAGNFTPLQDDPAVVNGGNTYGVLASDFDNDGDLDIIGATWGGAPEYYENLGGMKFQKIQLGDLGASIIYAGSIATGDYDNDGDQDVYVGNWPNLPGASEENHFYINQNSSGNWLKVKLEGTKSNRSGIGAKVFVTSTIDGKEVTQLREVSGSQNWRSQSALIQHFGLGDSNQVTKILVKWPSGDTTELENIGINQTLNVKEGD